MIMTEHDNRWAPGGEFDRSTVKTTDRVACAVFGHDATFGLTFGWCRRCKHTAYGRRRTLYYGRFYSFPPRHDPS